MKYITHSDIQKLNIRKKVFFDWAKECLLQKDKTILPAKTSIALYNNSGFFNTMPSVLLSENVYGAKIVSRNPKVAPSLRSNILLYNLETSNCLALLDGDYITAFRTAACAVLSIKTLARKNFKTIGLIGLGNICRATLLVLLDVFKNKQLTLKLYLYKNNDNNIIQLLSDKTNVIIETFDNIKDVVVDSDVVISSVTYAPVDLTDPSWFKKGSLLVPIHTRGFLNCDKAFDRIIVDDFIHTKHFKNFDYFKNCYELSSVLDNKKLGRKNNDERIIAYNVGISILDIYFAKKILNLIKVCQRFGEEDIRDKYWVK